MRDAGLLTGVEPHLTDKGRDWLHQLEQTPSEEIAQDWAADLILSTNAITR